MVPCSNLTLAPVVRVKVSKVLELNTVTPNDVGFKVTYISGPQILVILSPQPEK